MVCHQKCLCFCVGIIQSFGGARGLLVSVVNRCLICFMECLSRLNSLKMVLQFVHARSVLRANSLVSWALSTISMGFDICQRRWIYSFSHPWYVQGADIYFIQLTNDFQASLMLWADSAVYWAQTLEFVDVVCVFVLGQKRYPQPALVNPNPGKRRTFSLLIYLHMVYVADVVVGVVVLDIYQSYQTSLFWAMVYVHV